MSKSFSGLVLNTKKKVMGSAPFPPAGGSLLYFCIEEYLFLSLYIKPLIVIIINFTKPC
jgi:hypothetical protein